MRKYNFILSADNVGIFIKRLQAIVNITGCAIAQSEYTGAQEIDGYLRSLGMKTVFGPNPVVKTHPSYILGYKVTYRPENAQGKLYIHINSDCVLDIVYGTKIQMTPNKISYKRINDWTKSSAKGMMSTIATYNNLDKALSQTLYKEATADQYWKDVEQEWLDGSIYR